MSARSCCCSFRRQGVAQSNSAQSCLRSRSQSRSVAVALGSDNITTQLGSAQLSLVLLWLSLLLVRTTYGNSARSCCTSRRSARSRSDAPVLLLLLLLLLLLPRPPCLLPAAPLLPPPLSPLPCDECSIFPLLLLLLPPLTV